MATHTLLSLSGIRGSLESRRLLSVPNISFVLLAVSVGILVVYPTAMLIYGSFWSGLPGAAGQFTLDNYFKAYSSPGVYQMLLNSFWIVGMETCISLLLGGFLAFLVTRTDLPYRRLLQVLIPLPFFIPGLLQAIGWATLASPSSGYLNQLTRVLVGQSYLNIYSHAGLIFEMSLASTALAYILMIGPMSSFDSSLEESSRMSGAGAFTTLRRITIPLLAPLLLGTFIFVFIIGLEAFEGPSILGTPARIYLFTNKIYDAINNQQPPDFPLAMALSMFLLILTLALLMVQWKITAGKDYATLRGRGRYQSIKLGRWRNAVIALVAIYFTVAVVLPLGTLVLASFFKVFGLIRMDLLTLDNYKTVFSDRLVLRSITNSLWMGSSIATAGMIVCCAVAYIITRTQRRGRRILEFFVWLPWALPGMVLGVGILWAYIKVPVLGFSLYSTIWIMLVAYMTRSLPLGVRSVQESMRQIGKELEEGGRVHGGNWLYVFRRILMPLAWPGVAAGWILVFFGVVRELNASILLYSNGTEVISVAIFQYWAQGRGQMVSVLAVFLLVMMGILLGVERLLRKEWAL